MDRVRVDAVRTGARRARGPVVTDREASEVVAVLAAAGVKGAAGVKAVAVIATRARWGLASVSSPS
ncbi:hypothetical protein JYJ95_36655 [Corallococcus exiguus]|uniref:hypothetical protein n=1 Tax=Corallococcus exiguus TaxID=83462 RepID=UPI001A8C5DF9|nr:hypothetical protein [Corallococcus exiguus]MBN8472066.1 hypothetical protein [Corallococcus exiguus]